MCSERCEEFGLITQTGPQNGNLQTSPAVPELLCFLDCVERGQLCWLTGIVQRVYFGRRLSAAGVWDLTVGIYTRAFHLSSSGAEPG